MWLPTYLSAQMVIYISSLNLLQQVWTSICRRLDIRHYGTCAESWRNNLTGWKNSLERVRKLTTEWDNLNDDLGSQINEVWNTFWKIRSNEGNASWNITVFERSNSLFITHSSLALTIIFIPWPTLLFAHQHIHRENNALSSNINTATVTASGITQFINSSCRANIPCATSRTSK